MVPCLLGLHTRVKALLYPEETSCIIDHENLEIVYGDITDIDWDSILAGVDEVIHLAAKVHVLTKRDEIWDEFHETNVAATRLLCEAAVRNCIKKLIFISTVGVHGDYPQVDNIGDLIVEPLTLYARSKLMAEEEVIKILSGRVSYLIFRPVMMYGIGDRGNMGRMINAIAKKRFVLPGFGSNKKSAMFVDDFAGILCAACTSTDLENEICIVSNHDVLTLREMCDEISNHVARGWQVPQIPEVLLRWAGKLGDLFSFLPVNSKVVNKLSVDSDFSSYSTVQERLGILEETSFSNALTKMGY